MADDVIKKKFKVYNSNLLELDKKIKKIDTIKMLNFIMSYLAYRDDNKMLKYVSRNISIWKMCVIVFESYIKQEKIYEKDIIKNIQCSVMTTNTYLKELLEIGIIYQEQDQSDKRKKYILPTQPFINEMNLFIEHLNKKVEEVIF
jgi:DNA-binding MarR family transcriptional regulator